MQNHPIVIEQIYAVPVETVWKAITDKEKMKQWYFTINDFKLEVGAVFSFYEPGGANQYFHRCVIQEIIPNRKFRHTWTHPDHSKGESMMTWDLEQLDYGTKLTLTHAGIENFADAGEGFQRKNYEAGWNEILSISLHEFLEN